MKKEIYERLTALTEEEKRILDGSIEVNKEIYTDNKSFIIDSNKFLSRDELIDIRRHTRFIKFPEHKHNYIEFNYVYQGKLIEKINDREIVLKKGELIFLNQNISHELGVSDEEDISINFIIKPEFFDYIFGILGNDNVITKFLITTLYTGYKNGEYLYFKVSEERYIQEILEKIIVEIYTNNTMSKVTIKLLVALLIVELIKKPEYIEVYSVDNFERMLIISVFNYVDEFYCTASLSDISKQLNQPDYKISKLLKKHTKLNFKELLQERRLSKAIEILKLSDIPINEVMEKVGYENPTYFYKIFKEKYGVTPKEYKNKYLNS